MQEKEEQAYGLDFLTEFAQVKTAYVTTIGLTFSATRRSSCDFRTTAKLPHFRGQ